jgi:predicted AlkP superfamily pyrophosphatase or phosphodiesterase
MDEITAALALEGVRQLGIGHGPATDVLAVSFSATDLIGHRTGPDSRELHDQVLRLDRTIGAFIDSLYKLRDSTRIIFALTADHGVSSYPELNSAHLAPAPLRVRVRPAVEAAESVLVRAKGNLAALDLESGALFLDPRAAGVNVRVVREAIDSFVAVGRRIPGVLRVDRMADLSRADTVNDKITRRWIHMFPTDQPVQAVVTLTPGSYWDPYSIAMHGTPHDYDTNVPIIFYGSSFKPGRYAEFVRTVDIAPTLARVLGVKPTERLDGHALTMVIK